MEQQLFVVDGLSRGFTAYVRGLQWLRQHPGYLVILLLPMLLGFALMVTGWTYLFRYDEEVFQWILFPKPVDWWWQILYYACRFFLYLGFLVLGLVAFVLVANILASPIYEWVSVAVEKDLFPENYTEISFWQTLKLVGEEIKKVVFILFISLLIFIIPGLNVVALFATAFLLGWDFYDYPLARRGWTFRQRRQFVMKDIWAAMGLGLWLVIPFAQFFMMPFAVVGGTILSLERLKKEGWRAPGNL